MHNDFLPFLASFLFLSSLSVSSFHTAIAYSFLRSFSLHLARSRHPLSLSLPLLIYVFALVLSSISAQPTEASMFNNFMRLLTHATKTSEADIVKKIGTQEKQEEEKGETKGGRPHDLIACRISSSFLLLLEEQLTVKWICMCIYLLCDVCVCVCICVSPLSLFPFPCRP